MVKQVMKNMKKQEKRSRFKIKNYSAFFFFLWRSELNKKKEVVPLTKQKKEKKEKKEKETP